jgi:DME family drug/metabolite transporter
MNLPELLFLNLSLLSGQSAELKGVLFALTSAVCWAVSSSVYRKGLETTDPWSGNLIRTGIASVGFFIVMILKGTELSSITVPLLFWLFFSAFFAFFLGDLFFLMALKGVGVSRTVPISSTYPLFVTVFAFVVYQTPVSILVVVGTLFIVGAIKLISEEKDAEPHDTKGIFIALAAAVCWAISTIVLDYLLLFLPSEAVAGVRFFITWMLTTAVVSKKSFTITRSSLVWIGGAGSMLLIFSNYTFLEAIRMAGSTKVAPIVAIYPVISVFLAALFLKETLTLKIVSGTVLSFLGVLFVVLG